MSELVRIIRGRIAAEGPMSVAEYMALCLGHPRHGYYVTRDPLGAAGDFTTAPEISQMFGEMVGLWLRAVWQGMGAPEGIRIVELGPGRGTLMADARRALGPLAGAELWLVETSPRLRAEQAKRLPDAHWADRLEDVPEGPTLIVANEFLDALPVRQYLATAGGWRERQVGLEGDRLIWGLSGVLPGLDPAPEGAWREHSGPAEAVAREIARRIGQGGAALLIDYGYTAADRPAGPTLQAVKGHAHADPLAAPGEVDLTWLIDFDWLAGALSPHAAAVTTQGAFLAALGIGHRAASLARAHPDRADEIADALERLTGPEGMGTLFKVLVALPAGSPPPPGFEETP